MPFTSTPVETVIMDYSDLEYGIDVYIPNADYSENMPYSECSCPW